MISCCWHDSVSGLWRHSNNALPAAAHRHASPQVPGCWPTCVHHKTLCCLPLLAVLAVGHTASTSAVLAVLTSRASARSIVRVDHQVDSALIARHPSRRGCRHAVQATWGAPWQGLLQQRACGECNIARMGCKFRACVTAHSSSNRVMAAGSQQQQQQR